MSLFVAATARTRRRTSRSSDDLKPLSEGSLTNLRIEYPESQDGAGTPRRRLRLRSLQGRPCWPLLRRLLLQPLFAGSAWRRLVLLRRGQDNRRRLHDGRRARLRWRQDPALRRRPRRRRGGRRGGQPAWLMLTAVVCGWPAGRRRRILKIAHQVAARALAEVVLGLARVRLEALFAATPFLADAGRAIATDVILGKEVAAVIAVSLALRLAVAIGLAVSWAIGAAAGHPPVGLRASVGRTAALLVGCINAGREQEPRQGEGDGRRPRQETPHGR